MVHPLEHWESWVDRQIREAQERGEFDDLPGTGKPLKAIDRPHDPDWWVKGLIEREQLDLSAALPPALALRREIEMLPTRLAEAHTKAAAREIAEELNARIVAHRRAPAAGPAVIVRTIDVEAAIEQWSRATRRS